MSGSARFCPARVAGQRAARQRVAGQRVAGQRDDGTCPAAHWVTGFRGTGSGAERADLARQHLGEAADGPLGRLAGGQARGMSVPGEQLRQRGEL